MQYWAPPSSAVFAVNKLEILWLCESDSSFYLFHSIFLSQLVEYCCQPSTIDSIEGGTPATVQSEIHHAKPAEEPNVTFIPVTLGRPAKCSRTSKWLVHVLQNSALSCMFNSLPFATQSTPATAFRCALCTHCCRAGAPPGMFALSPTKSVLFFLFPLHQVSFHAHAGVLKSICLENEFRAQSEIH